MSKTLTERQIRQLIRKAIILSEGTPPPPNSLVPSTVPAATAAAALNLPNPTDYYEVLSTPYTLSFPKPTDASSGTIERFQIEAVMRPEGKGSSGKKYGIIFDGELKRFFSSFDFPGRLKAAHDAQNGSLKNEIVLSLAIVLEVLADFKKAKSGTDFGFTASPPGLKALSGHGMNTRLQGQLSGAPFDELVVAGYGIIDKEIIDVDIPTLSFYTQAATGLQSTMQTAATAAAVQGNGIQAGLYQGAAWAAGNIPIPWARTGTWNLGDWAGENLNSTGPDPTPWELDGFVNPGKAFYNMGQNGLDKFLTNQMDTSNANGMIKEGPVTNNEVISAVMSNLKEGIEDSKNGRAAMTTTEFWKVVAVYYYIATGGAELVGDLKQYIGDVYDAFESRTGGFDDIAERLTDTLSGASEETSGRRYGRGER